MPLHLRASRLREKPPLILGFDAFRRDRQSDGAAQRGNGLHDGGRIPVGGVPERLDEGAVDLDLVDLEAPQVAQARMPASEIVQRDAESRCPQALECIAGQRVAEQDAFGDLELDIARVGAAL